MLENVSSFIKKNQVFACTVGGIVLLALMFFLGRSTAPVKTEVKTVTQIKEVETKHAETKVSDTKQEDTVKDKDIHRTKTTVVQKDGSRTTTETTDVTSHSDTAKTEVKYVDRVVTQTVTVEKQVLVDKIVEKAKPDWIVGLKVGTTFNHLQVQVTPPYLNPLIVGAEVDRRIAGSVYLGVWGMTDVKLNNVSGGLAVSVQF